ncbi:ariadne RING finger [Tothia fuscella]|uniref:RBR-type E3 ubiquitin transferase n=1 Tax=Tothia fuscella TaxID=1048955 RepID=A0A9P4NIM0_9PEZI|nr:ariadne RING finger [Tothia fuscella]
MSKEEAEEEDVLDLYPGIGVTGTSAEGASLGKLKEGQTKALKRKRDIVFDHDDEANDESQPSSSKRTHTDNQRNAIDKLTRDDYQCTVCTDSFRFDAIIRLNCKHFYCPKCLKDLFIHASSDMTLFPPRCCRVEIPLSLIGDAMTPQQMEDFTDAVIESTTEKRTYCSNAQCGKFIPPMEIDADDAKCGRCGFVTCVHCRSPSHEGECLQDEALQSTLALAARQGWRRCNQCRAMVELNVGCYHMTCKCGGEFCYLCGVAWKGCTCPQWEEDRLVARAEEVAARQPTPAAAENLQAPQRRAPEIQEQLRENHRCQHSRRFRRLDAPAGQPFVCEMCSCACSKFILECRMCQIAVCERCRLNRVR